MSQVQELLSLQPHNVLTCQLRDSWGSELSTLDFRLSTYFVFTAMAEISMRALATNAATCTVARAGRGSGKTSRRCERHSIPITKSHCRESTRRKRERQLNRHTRAVSRACRSGNRRRHGPNAMGPSHGRVRRRASIWTHGGRWPMRPKTGTRRAIARRGHSRVADASPRRRRRSSHKAQ